MAHTPINTGNAVPSADARDRADNSANLDIGMNGKTPAFFDRLGFRRETWFGMERRFNGIIEGLGWSSAGDYAAGIIITSHNQVVEHEGQPYALKSTVPASIEAPYVTTGDWATEGVNFKLVGDSSLRQELGAPDGASLVNGAVVSVKDAAALRALPGTKNTKAVVELGGNGALLNSLYYLDTDDIASVDDGGLVIASAEGPRWKLAFTDSIDIRIFPVASGGDITVQMNAAAMALYSVGGGTLHVRGDYTISGTVQMLPHVTIKGAGSGSSPRITYTGAGAAFETTRPAGWVPNVCIDSHVFGLTMIGPGMATSSIGVSIRNAIQCSVKLNEIALFGSGIAWNVGATSFENLEQAYFNVVEQNSIKPCGRGHSFFGAANRNTISTNNIADADVGYDFALGFSVSETNTFLNENIEGCRVWAEWGGTIYSQTWVGITIENPASNGYVCEVKDPGRQVFLNLSLIPLGNEDAISMYSLAGATPSAIFGSAASSGTERLGIRLNEEVRIYDHIRYMANYGSTTFSGMIPANSMTTTTITLASAELNDMVSVGALRDLAGCTLQSWAEAGVVRVNIINGTGANITIPETEIRAVLSKVA